MARQMTVRLTDDLDGSDAQTTVRFVWEDVTYEIDLTSEHAEQFSAAVRPYLVAARRVGPVRGGRRGGTAGGRARAGRSVGEQHVIREWARNHGFQLADRGRIPRRVLDAYEGAQQNDVPSAGAEPTSTANRTRPAPARKATGKKRAAAKAIPAAKTTARNSTAKRTTAKKASARKAAAKKVAAKKTTANKTRADKATASNATRRTRRARATVKAS